MNDVSKRFVYPQSIEYSPGSARFTMPCQKFVDAPEGTWGNLVTTLTTHRKQVNNSSFLNQMNTGTRFQHKLQNMKLVPVEYSKFTPVGGSIPRVVQTENSETPMALIDQSGQIVRANNGQIRIPTPPATEPPTPGPGVGTPQIVQVDIARDRLPTGIDEPLGNY